MQKFTIGGDGTLNEVANGFFLESVDINGSQNNSKVSSNSKFPLSSKLKPVKPDAEMGIIAGGTETSWQNHWELARRGY